MNLHTKFEVRSFTRSWDIAIGVLSGLEVRSPTQNSYRYISETGKATNFKFCVQIHRIDQSKIPLKISRKIGVGIERGRKVSGIVPSERALVSSYRPSIVIFPLSLRVSEILPLLCSSTPLFRTPPLVSPKIANVPLVVGGWPLGYEERTCWANCPCDDPDPPTLHSDRETNRRTTSDRQTDLCTILHCAVKRLGETE